MPNPAMFSNKAALEKAANRVAWKLRTSTDYFLSLPEAAKRTSYAFDYRDLINLGVLFADMSDCDDMPEEDRKKEFISRVQEIKHAFLDTANEKGVPDFSVVGPLLRRMYDEVDVDYENIDWNDEKAIDHLLSSVTLQQTLGTMSTKFAVEMTKSYTVEEKIKLDHRGVRAFSGWSIFQNLLYRENPTYSQNLRWGAMDMGTRQFYAEHGLALELSMTKGPEDPVVLDPEASEISKAFFMEDKFTMAQTGEINETPYDDVEAAVNYADAFSRIHERGSFGNTLASPIIDEDVYSRYNTVMINGKPASDIYERQLGRGMSKDVAKATVGKMIRKALLDGKSVVTIMRPVLDKNGKTVFTHQEVKVDLDKINRIDRQENYGRFRRFLDALHIYRIPPMCASNKARDAAQAETKATAEYKAAITKVEDKFIARYNEYSQKNTKYKYYATFPETSRLENANDKQLSHDPLDAQETRTHLDLKPSDLEPSRKTEVEPKKEVPPPTVESVKK